MWFPQLTASQREALEWAYETGIFDGASDIDPNDAATIADVLTIILRVCDAAGIDII